MIGTVYRSNLGDISVPLTVTLQSSDTDAITVPATVTILPNLLHRSFPITVVDDHRLHGTQVVTVTASAPTLLSGSATIDVTDYQTVTLNIASDSVTENAGPVAGSTTAVVTRSTTNDLSSPLTVNLLSSDSGELTVPQSVVIPGRFRQARPRSSCPRLTIPSWTARKR